MFEPHSPPGRRTTGTTMPHSPDFEEEVTHADQDMDLKDEMELQIALADPRLVDDDVLEKAGFKPEEIKVWQEEREFHYSMLQAGFTEAQANSLRKDLAPEMVARTEATYETLQDHKKHMASSGEGEYVVPYFPGEPVAVAAPGDGHYDSEGTEDYNSPDTADELRLPTHPRE